MQVYMHKKSKNLYVFAGNCTVKIGNDQPGVLYQRLVVNPQTKQAAIQEKVYCRSETNFKMAFKPYGTMQQGEQLPS